jgi:hypothetical protein
MVRDKRSTLGASLLIKGFPTIPRGRMRAGIMV